MKTSMVKKVRQLTPPKQETINIFTSVSNRTIFKIMLPITVSLITSGRCGRTKHSLKEKGGQLLPKQSRFAGRIHNLRTFAPSCHKRRECLIIAKAIIAKVEGSLHTAVKGQHLHTAVNRQLHTAVKNHT